MFVALIVTALAQGSVDILIQTILHKHSLTDTV
jgi:hypothetical protein